MNMSSSSLLALALALALVLAGEAGVAEAGACRVQRVIDAPRQREGGGFIVRRVLGAAVSELDPFLMLDHFGPVTYGPGEAVGAPDHPHRGFETVTYMLEGEVRPGQEGFS